MTHENSLFIIIMIGHDDNVFICVAIDEGLVLRIVNMMDIHCK